MELPYILAYTLPFFSALRPNFSINIFILSFTKVQVKSCDGFTKYSFVISILRHPLPSASSFEPLHHPAFESR